MMNNYNKYLELFGTNTSEMSHIIEVALSCGGDYADLFFENTTTTDLSLSDSEVNAAGHYIDSGVGIRVLANDKTGYAYTEIISIDEMEKAAITAAKIADAQNTEIPINNISILKGKNYYPLKKQLDDFSIKECLPYLYQYDHVIRERDSRIVSVQASISITDTKILFINSLCESFCDHRPMISFVGNCTMEDNGKRESGGCSYSLRMGYEMLSTKLIDSLVDKTIKNTSILFKSIQPKGGIMPVVMGAGSSGILLHEAMGHAFEADFNRKKTSIFCDKMGKKICNNKISIVDDGTIMHNRGALNFDDEGVKGQKTYMVTNGVLTSFLHDRISAKFYGVAPTGNGRRESFKYPPIPRMRATYMENGTTSKADLISSVKKGIYVDNFSNGQVNIGEGDFTFFVKNGYLIENGKLTQPVKDINIIGNGPQALSDIIDVGNDFSIENATWICGKEQYCPVSCGMPSVLIKNLSVGGNV